MTYFQVFNFEIVKMVHFEKCVRSCLMRYRWVESMVDLFQFVLCLIICLVFPELFKLDLAYAV